MNAGVSCALALGTAALAGGISYLAAPRQQWLATRLRPRAAVAIALPLLALGALLMGTLIGPAPGLFAVLAAWMLALVSYPWLVALSMCRKPDDGE